MPLVILKLSHLQLRLELHHNTEDLELHHTTESSEVFGQEQLQIMTGEQNGQPCTYKLLSMIDPRNSCRTSPPFQIPTSH
jgi:hypothetical protein